MLVGINLGGGLYSWQDAHTLGPLVVGIVMVVVFAWYQWKGTASGILHHDLFVEGRGRYFSIYLALIFIKGLMGFSYFTFYPIMEAVLFVTEPIRLVASQLPFWVAGGLFSFLWGALSTRFKTIREPLIAGFLIWTAGLVGLATIQPGDYISSMAFSGLTGLGFGSPLFLAVVGVQFVIPHRLLATSTALLFSTRAIGPTIAVAIYSAALRDRLSVYLSRDVSKAVLSAGLPTTSVSAFIEHLFVSDIPGLADIAGVTPAVLAAGIAAFKQAYADALRVAFIISAPFGVVAVILSFFVADIGHEMTYRVDAPVEELHSKAHGAHKSEM